MPYYMIFTYTEHLIISVTEYVYNAIYLSTGLGVAVFLRFLCTLLYVGRVGVL